jgi:acetyltransferase
MTLSGGTELIIRPIRPEDEPAFVQFHTTLSEQSVYRRYFYLMNLDARIRHERLTRMCFIDYDRQMALIAEQPRPNGASSEIAGVARLIKTPGTSRAEVAVLVSDAFHKRGIGSALVRRLVGFAKDERLELLTATFLADNKPIEALFRSLGFTFSEGSEPELRYAELRL